MEIAGVITEDGVFLEPVETHDCAAVGEMSLEIFVCETLNGLSKDQESDNLDVELSHLDDVKSHELVGDLLLRTFSAVNCSYCLRNTCATENS